jgi:tetratricopeptide (TPR) repeat protein
MVPRPPPYPTLLTPALRGDRAAVHTALAATHDTDDDATLTAAARALFALGDRRDATRWLRRALDRGGPQADALASVSLPDPSAALARRLGDPDPAIRADAACDMAWRRLRAGDRSAAGDAIEHALRMAPHHAEARHWWDWLQDSGDPVGDLAALDAGGGTSRDARALCPRVDLGWLSPERWWRRIMGGLWSRPAPGGTALHRLQRWGVVSRALAADACYRRLPFEHPLAAAERTLDRARSRARQDRCPADAAQEAWRLVGRVAPDALVPMARALTRLGAEHPGAAPTGLVAVEVLSQVQPASARWPAARARLLAHVHRPAAARAEARAALRRSDLDAGSFIDAVHALSAAGADEEARGVARRACRDPRLAPAAEQLLAVRPRRRTPDPRRPPGGRQNRPRPCRPLRRPASSPFPAPGSSTS